MTTFDQATKALFGAVINNQPNEILESIQAGADVNLRDAGGRTALMFARANGSDDIVSLLLQAGADSD